MGTLLNAIILYILWGMTYTVMDIQNERRGFVILSAIIAGFFILSLMVMVFNVKER